MTPDEQRLERAARKAAKDQERRNRRKRLTIKQELFCRHYVANGGNALQAALSAGYGRGVHRPTANVKSMDMLNRPLILRRIQEIQKKAFRRINMDIKQAVDNLAKFASREPSGDAANDRNTISANVEFLKVNGAYTEKVQVTSDAGEEVALKDLELDIVTQKMLLNKMREAKKRKEANRIKFAQISGTDEEEETDSEE